MSYRVAGRTAATAAVNNAVCTLWNPSTAFRIHVIEFGVFITTAGTAAQTIIVQRATARGTAGSTVTPDIDNDSDRLLVPPSGALLDLAAYSAQPTFDASELFRFPLANVAGSGVVIPFDVDIPPGTGLTLKATLTAWPASDVNFNWREAG